MCQINDILLRLIGSGELTRKKLSDVCRCSLAHVDQIFRGESDWSSCNMNGVNEWEAIIKMAFDLEFSEIRKRFLKRGELIVDFDHLEMSLNGVVDDEVCDLLGVFTKVRSGKATEADKVLAHQKIEQMFEEVKK